MAALVDIAGVRYTYAGSAAPALDGASLRLDGGLCCVAGPSGGGKSTLLRLLNGLVPHLHGGTISGRVVVDGVDVLRSTTRRLATAVGFVFQDAERQAVHATVERDIAFGLENLGCERAEMHRRVHEVAERLAIGGLLTRAVSTLSGGERQRVAVAGVLVLRPRIVVLDEPLSQLDRPGAAAMLQLCIELRDAGTAVVVSEHRLDDLLPVADSLVLVDSGHVVGPGRPDTLAARLDSAPQVVRLAAAMGWDPPLLDAAAVRVPRRETAPAPAGGRDVVPSGAQAWCVDGVSAGWGSLLADVSASGEAGEVLAVMGANGSGKTTLLRVIAGLVPPSAGHVSRRAGRVAYLPQNPGALLHRESVGAEVTAGTRGEASRRRAAALAGALGVDALWDSDPRDLSSGQRQRVAVAAVLAGDPTIALLDEPTRGMDGRARAGLVAAVRAIAAAGTSVVVATHDAELAAAVADRVLVVSGGGVVDRGPPTVALSGDHPFATQLGRRVASPGPVTVEAFTRLLSLDPTETAAGQSPSAGAGR